MEEGLESERVRISMSLADILNYIVPGATLLIFVILFEITAPDRSSDSPHRAAEFWRTIEPFVTNGGWLIPTLLGLAIVLLSYVAGHLVDSVSMLLIDRTLVFKGYGYPYANLLVPAPDENTAASHNAEGLEPHDPIWDPYSATFYRGAFLLLNAYFSLRFTELVFRHTGWRVGEMTARDEARFVMVLFVIQVALKIVSGGSRAEHDTWLKRQLQHERWGRALYDFARKLAGIVASPMNLIVGILKPVLNTRFSFNASFRKKYLIHFERRFGLAAHTAQSNNFWLTYCFLTSHSPSLTASLRRWETLFLFSRNLSTALFLYFQFVLIWLFMHSPFLSWRDKNVATALEGAAFAYVLSLILLIHFYYLYVSYFSKFLYRSFVFLAQQLDPVNDDGQSAVRHIRQGH